MTPAELRSRLAEIRSALDAREGDLFRLQAVSHHLDRLIADAEAAKDDSLADALFQLFDAAEDRTTRAVLGAVWYALVGDDMPGLARALVPYMRTQHEGMDLVLDADRH